MKKIFISIAAIAILTSCRHESDLKSENGFVIEKVYSPEFNASGSGVGFNSDGKTTVSSSSIHGDEKYTLVFECEHQVVFSINSADLYYRLNKGDSVTIEYKNILNRKNEIKGYEFVNAIKK